MRRAGIARIGSFVPHPPANALLLVPLATLSPAAAKAAWTLLLALAYAATLPVLRALTGLPAWSVALVLLLPTSSLKNALAYGQPYPLLLLLLSLSALLIVRGRGMPGGLALAPVLALKLYALPHALFLLLGARFRALLGLAAGLVALLGLSVAALGIELHRVYLAEILPRSLAGEIQDPYSPLWGSISSLAHRLFQAEPDLNPRPAALAPWLVAPVARGVSTLLVLLALAARPTGEPALVLRRQWAVLTLSALAASPLTQSYHFLLLALPVALLLGDQPSRGRAAVVLGLFAFSTSPLPHYLLGFAQGWTNPLAYPRLFAVLTLLLLALRGSLSKRRLTACGGLALAAGLLAPAAAPDPGWQRVVEARGYLAAEPVACEGGIAWLAILDDRYVIRHSDGRVLRGAADLLSPRCVGGRLEPGSDDESERDAWGALRPLATGRLRRPRLSPDGRSVLAQSWEDRSWDIRIIDRDTGVSRRLTSQPSNEVEPAWGADGASVLFASDWRRGLGSTALYRIELR